MLKNIVSVDIGSRLIKLAQLRQSEGKIRLDKVGIVKNPISKREAASKRIKRNAVIQAIKHSLKKNGIKGKDAVSSLAGSSLLLQYFKFPPLSEKDLESTVRLEAERIMSSRLAEMDSDFQVLSSQKEKKKEKKVLFVAVPKIIVHHRLEILREAGLNPIAVDIDSMALANSFSRLKNIVSKESVMVLNLGARVVNLAILNEESLHLLRDISLDLEGPLNLEDKDILKRIIEEIRRSIHYYETREKKNKLARIFLTGGAATVSGLTDSFSKILGVPAEKWNPLKTIEYGPRLRENKGYFLAIAIGLGLRER